MWPEISIFGKFVSASEQGRFKCVCCIPHFVVVIFVLLCVVTAAVLIATFGIHNINNKQYTAVDSVLIAIAIVVGIAVVGNTYTWAQLTANLLMSPKRRLARIMSHLPAVGIEGFLQKVKKEVEWIGHTVDCIDAFQGTVAPQ